MNKRPHILRTYQVAGFESIQVMVTHGTLEGQPCVVLEDPASVTGRRLALSFEHVATSYRIELAVRRQLPWGAPLRFVHARHVPAPRARFQRVYEEARMAFDRARYSNSSWSPVSKESLRFSATVATADWLPQQSPS